MDLTGKTALVTGGTRGIGRAIVLELAQRGARVYVHGRDSNRAADVAREASIYGRPASVVIADLLDSRGLVTVVEEVLKITGEIDILVNNAGGPTHGVKGWDQTGMDAWSSNAHLNLFAPVMLAQAVFPGMQRSGWGRIINLGTGWGIQPSAMAPAYSAAKAALWNATVSLSKSLAETGITVNMVTPGPVLTESSKTCIENWASRQAQMLEPTEMERVFVQKFAPNPTGRMARESEVAAAVGYLAGRNADYVNGLNLRIDGGLHA